jgi:molybdopterin molybdotransferase
MLTLDEARSRLMTGVRRLATERVALRAAPGRVLREDLVALAPIPSFDHSAMDGYAVAIADLAAEPPFSLQVSGESRAGREATALQPATACRIFTGSPIPPRADAVIMQEHVTRDGDRLRFDALPKKGQHIRRAGEDLAQGALGLGAGTRLSPASLALAAMLGRAELLVTRRPRVTILCTGDELRVPGDAPRPGSIPESNSAPLAALARQAAAAVRVAPIVPDDPDATRRAIEDALDGTDVLLTVGGVSVGDHDVVRGALEHAGVALDFWRVAIKPGKPLAVGKSDRAHVLGLPGNPASALVAFLLFGVPLLRVLQGDARPIPMPIVVRLAAARARGSDRLELVRASLRADGDRFAAYAYGNQASGAATNLAHSDGVALIPAGERALEAGALVDFVRWSDA